MKTPSKLKVKFKQIQNYLKPDFEFKKTYVSSSDEQGKITKKLDSFYFYVKQPCSNSYQFHAPIEANIHILTQLSKETLESIVNGRHLELEVQGSWGSEYVLFRKSLLPKLHKELRDMIFEIKGIKY